MTNINELLNEAYELVPRISFDDANAILDDPNTIILDVREGQELRESGKIKGAIHVPRGLLEFIFRPEDHVEDPEKMKILVLSRNKNLYSTRRIIHSAEKLGHEVRVVDYLRCYMNITSKKPTVIFRGEKLENYDAVISRIGASYTFYGAAVVRQFEMAGLFTINRSEAITRSRDKLRSLQILAREGIGLPVTGFANHTADIDGMIDTVEGIPLVIKLLEGTQGKGVVLAETKKAASSVLSAFRQLKANILVQEFIKEADGKDIRAASSIPLLSSPSTSKELTPVNPMPRNTASKSFLN